MYKDVASFKSMCCIIFVMCFLQGGEDACDTLSCRSLFAKEPLSIRLFCGKGLVKIRHPLHLRHPVFVLHSLPIISLQDLMVS